MQPNSEPGMTRLETPLPWTVNTFTSATHSLVDGYSPLAIKIVRRRPSCNPCGDRRGVRFHSGVVASFQTFDEVECCCHCCSESTRHRLTNCLGVCITLQERLLNICSGIPFTYTQEKKSILLFETLTRTIFSPCLLTMCFVGLFCCNDHLEYLCPMCNGNENDMFIQSLDSKFRNEIHLSVIASLEIDDIMLDDDGAQALARFILKMPRWSPDFNFEIHPNNELTPIGHKALADAFIAKLQDNPNFAKNITGIPGFDLETERATLLEKKRQKAEKAERDKEEAERVRLEKKRQKAEKAERNKEEAERVRKLREEEQSRSRVLQEQIQNLLIEANLPSQCINKYATLLISQDFESPETLLHASVDDFFACGLTRGHARQLFMKLNPSEVPFAEEVELI